MIFKVAMLIAIFLAVLGISISYASLSAVIEIQTQGSVRQALWDVHFENLSTPEITPGSQIDIISPPQLVSGVTSIENFNVRFNFINSSVIYYVDLVNDGDLDAIIQDLEYPNPVCTTAGVYPLEETKDINAVCSNITYILEYVTTDTEVAVGDIITAGETQRLKLTFSYADNELPINEVTISGLGYELEFVQNR